MSLSRTARTIRHAACVAVAVLCPAVATAAPETPPVEAAPPVETALPAEPAPPVEKAPPVAPATPAEPAPAAAPAPHAETAVPPTAPPAIDPVAAWCDYLGTRLASVGTDACRARPFVAAKITTPGGNPLVTLDVAPVWPGVPAPLEAGRVLVIGGIHGDELTSISAVFRWLDWMDHPSARLYRWRIIPLANPDGLKASPSTRVNRRGVDLNRNFETPDWERDAWRYWHEHGEDPRRDPGRYAGSEIETLWLQQQIAQFEPDLIVSVHAPYNLLDYDGPVPEPLRFGRLALNRLGVYPGSLGNYGGVHKQIPVVTLELPHATRMPGLAEQKAMWEDMLAWMRKNIRGDTVPTPPAAKVEPPAPVVPTAPPVPPTQSSAVPVPPVSPAGLPVLAPPRQPRPEPAAQPAPPPVAAPPAAPVKPAVHELPAVPTGTSGVLKGLPSVATPARPAPVNGKPGSHAGTAPHR